MCGASITYQSPWDKDFRQNGCRRVGELGNCTMEPAGAGGSYRYRRDGDSLVMRCLKQGYRW